MAICRNHHTRFTLRPLRSERAERKAVHRIGKRWLGEMVTEREIWVAAGLLVERHGEGAEFHAAALVADLFEPGSMDGGRVWLEILEKVTELRREWPARGELVH